MNITDLKENEEVVGDMLAWIFERQTELEKRYRGIELKNGEDLPPLPLNVDTFEGQRRCRALIYRITEELYEAGNCLRNKAWKNTQVATDKDHFMEELSDSFHFMIQLFIELGVGPKELVELYSKKSRVNLFRQRSNY